MMRRKFWIQRTNPRSPLQRGAKVLELDLSSVELYINCESAICLRSDVIRDALRRWCFPDTC